MAPPPVRWLPAALGALLMMMTIGLGLVWWWGRQPEPSLAVLGTLPAFTLTDKSGATVTGATLAGRPWIADLVFTRCQLTCPRMTERMSSLGPRLAPGVRRVSVSVDPAHDTPAVLAPYAKRHKPSHRTGWSSPATRSNAPLAVEGFKLGVAAAAPRPAAARSR